LETGKRPGVAFKQASEGFKFAVFSQLYRLSAVAGWQNTYCTMETVVDYLLQLNQLPNVEGHISMLLSLPAAMEA
jgi:hypothetical protein